MFTVTWLLGFAASVFALTLCRAEARDGGAGGTDFDRPLRRALAYGLAAASLGLLLFYAMLGDGVVIPLVAAAVLGCGGFLALRKTPVALARWGGLAILLALFSFACVIAAFQQVYGDYFFGFDDPFAQ